MVNFPVGATLFHLLLLPWTVIGEGCGIQPDTQSRIVGGETSTGGRWPWMAALFKSTASQYCAGVLISDRHVLTAAHCVNGVQARKLLVRLGQLDIPGRAKSNASALDRTDVASGSFDSNPNENFYGVRKTILHSKYDPPTHLHDIAILRLDRVVRFTAAIQRICLPPPSLHSLDGQDAFVAGWGTLDFMGASSASLMEVRVPIWKNEDCQRAIGKNVFNSTLCAGGTQKPADACQGDSGGALMLPMADRRWAAVGVVSWGIRCGLPSKPGVYTRTSHYIDWILHTVQTT